MAKAADIGGLLAQLPTAGKLDDFRAKLEDRVGGYRTRLDRRVADAKSLAAKGVLAHYLASGVGVGSVLLVLYGCWGLLSRVLDPALAALALGLGLIAILITAVVIATRKREASED